MLPSLMTFIYLPRQYCQNITRNSHFSQFNSFSFTSNHSSSVMFSLTDPTLYKKMKKAKVYWNRFQTGYDRQIFQLCLKLQKEKLVAVVRVDKHHITTIIRQQGDQAIPIYDIEVLPSLFNQDPLVLEIVSTFRVVVEAEEDIDEASPEATAEDSN